jgi:Protein of unknown function (DUF3500)
MELVDNVAAAGRAFLDGLDDEQARDALLPFDEEQRRSWAYWPTERRGIPLWRLDRGQTKAAHRLVATLLAVPAYARAVTIMALDEVLDRMEGYRSDRRHGEDYWLSIFRPPEEEVWGVRFEGHHISLHATFSHGVARLTPLFLGANPAVVHDDGLPAVAPLGPEEQLGFELLHALSTEERAAAVVSDEAPDDIVTRNQGRVDHTPPPSGVPLNGLRSEAAACARALLEVYLGRFPPGSLRPDPRQATFSWAGAYERGTGHYYRISGPRLLIEFDNTQNGANHIHTVIRDPVADFGDDVLAAHFQGAHPFRRASSAE